MGAVNHINVDRLIASWRLTFLQETCHIQFGFHYGESRAGDFPLLSNYDEVTVRLAFRPKLRCLRLVKTL